MIQPEGKRPMSARDFLAGHRIASGSDDLRLRSESGEVAGEAPPINK